MFYGRIFTQLNSLTKASTVKRRHFSFSEESSIPEVIEYTKSDKNRQSSAQIYSNPALRFWPISQVLVSFCLDSVILERRDILFHDRAMFNNFTRCLTITYVVPETISQGGSTTDNNLRWQ